MVITAGELVLALISAERIDKIPSALFPFTLATGRYGDDTTEEWVIVDESEEFDYIGAILDGVGFLTVHWDCPAVMSTLYDIEAR